jgi:hypothetical protein
VVGVSVNTIPEMPFQRWVFRRKHERFSGRTES